MRNLMNCPDLPPHHPAEVVPLMPLVPVSVAAAAPLVSLHQARLTLGGHPVLHATDLAIAPGERVALVGANGSGKSSLLRVLHGLVGLSGGQRTVHAGLRQAMLFQRPHMLRASVLNNVTLGLWLGGVRWRDARTQALAALGKVGLSDQAHRPAKALSGGQQQRLALARACCLMPHMLLLDEPTASLDPHAKRDVESLIADLGADITLVFASHNLGQVKRLATRVLYLEHGRVLADLPVHEFFSGEVLPRHFPEAHLFVQGEIA
jgi:tungstate transport system ATP-binding protein